MNIFKALIKYFIPVLRATGVVIFNARNLNRYSKHPEKYPFEDRLNFQYKMYRKVNKIMRVSVAYEGLENIPENPHFLISNHQSFYDPFLALGLKGPHISVAKKEISKFFVVGKVAKCTGTIFLNREDVREAVRVNKECVKVIESGKSIWMSPEGTRTKKPDMSMNEFKPGSLKAAFQTQVDIVPMVLDDTWKVFSEKYLGKPYVKCKVLKPVPYEIYGKMSTQEAADYFHDLIENELNKMRKVPNN